MPIHNPSFPLWSQHLIWCSSGPNTKCVSTYNHFPLMLPSNHQLCISFFAQHLDNWVYSTKYIFFPHLPLSSNSVLHAVFLIINHTDFNLQLITNTAILHNFLGIYDKLLMAHFPESGTVVLTDVYCFMSLIWVIDPTYIIFTIWFMTATV